MQSDRNLDTAEASPAKGLADVYRRWLSMPKQEAAAEAAGARCQQEQMGGFAAAPQPVASTHADEQRDPPSQSTAALEQVAEKPDEPKEDSREGLPPKEDPPEGLMMREDACEGLMRSKEDPRESLMPEDSTDKPAPVEEDSGDSKLTHV